jgi:hypothetical protein
MITDIAAVATTPASALTGRKLSSTRTRTASAAKMPVGTWSRRLPARTSRRGSAGVCQAAAATSSAASGQPAPRMPPLS